jgi:hypothetical protein
LYLPTPSSIASVWRRITLRRHRGELAALRRAKGTPQKAIWPVLFTIGLWFFLFALPSFMFLVAGINLMDSSDAALSIVGSGLFSVAMVYSFVLVVFVTPWFFGWCFIAAGLMFGRTGMADRKEADLIAAIAAKGQND